MVIDLRDIRGNIFGGDQMTEWTVMNGANRATFQNPQHALYDRVAAVRALAGDLPVEGRILFTRRGKFPKGLPRWTLMVDSLRAEFPPADSEASQSWMERYREDWQALCAARQRPARCASGAGSSREVFDQSSVGAHGRPKNRLRCGRAAGRQLLPAFSARLRHRCGNLGQECRFVASRRRLGFEAARQQVGRVGFDHQPSAGMQLHQRQQVQAAPLVADPAGDADGQVQRQVVVQFRCACPVKQCATPSAIEPAKLPQDRR